MLLEDIFGLVVETKIEAIGQVFPHAEMILITEHGNEIPIVTHTSNDNVLEQIYFEYPAHLRFRGEEKVVTVRYIPSKGPYPGQDVTVKSLAIHGGRLATKEK